MVPDFTRLFASIFTNDRLLLSVQIRQNQANLSFSKFLMKQKSMMGYLEI